MRCYQCGAENPEGTAFCQNCHAAFGSTPGGPPADTVEQLVAEARRAAKDLAQSSERLARQLAKKGAAAAKDPEGTARRAARKVARELEQAGADIERLLRDL